MLDTEYQESLEGQNLPNEQVNVPAEIPNEVPNAQVDDLDSLRQQLAALEAKLQQAEQSPRIEYKMPEEILELIDKPATLAMLHEDFKQKPVVELIKDAFREANPWATTDRHIEMHLKKQYPDIDFDMPDDLGLSEEEYDAIAWQAEGIRQQRIAQQDELRGKIEAAKNPVAASYDLEGYQQQFNEMVENGIGGVKVEKLPLEIPGYQYPSIDAETIRDIVYSDNVPLSLDREGNVWPNIQAAAAMAELQMLKSQIPAMLEAARRAAPKEAVEAMNRSLNNQVPQSNPGPIDPKQATQGAPMFNGLKIVGVQSNF
jgi:hypothetical protein